MLESDDMPVASYARPMPPPYSAAHRYLLYAFRQPDDFQIPEAYRGFTAMNRTNFPVADFIGAAGLDDPIAANYFYASNSSSTPPNYSASPTPGAGATPSPTGGSMPSGTGAGASPSYTGAATHVSFGSAFAIAAGVGAVFFGL